MSEWRVVLLLIWKNVNTSEVRLYILHGVGGGQQGLITLHFFLQKCKEGKLFKFGSLVNLMQL